MNNNIDKRSAINNKIYNLWRKKTTTALASWMNSDHYPKKIIKDMNDFINNDMLGKKCNICTGEYTEMGLDDDLHGCVTCCECGNRVNRYIVTLLRPANNIDLSFEISDKGTTIKNMNHSIYNRYDCDKCYYEGYVPCPDHYPEPHKKKESEETLTAKIDVLTEVIERIEKFKMPEQPLQEKSDYYRDIVGNLLADYKVKLIEL